MDTSWKFFIVEITYLIPVEQMTEVRAQHRAFLKEGYDKGWLLLSGPIVPATGGMIVARAPSQAAIEELLSRDPYQVNHVATYRFVEIDPIFHQSWLEDWITGPVA